MVYGNIKKLLPILALLVIFLAGCGGVTTPVSDETQIRNKIGQWSAAISAKNWELAKSCCYPGSPAYSTTEQLKATLAPYSSLYTIWVNTTVYSVNIEGNEATTIVNIHTEVCIVGYQGGCITDDTGLGTMTLIKNRGEWYLYS